MINAYPQLSAAQHALDAGRFRQAAHLALQHVRAHPEDPRGLGMLGTVAVKMGALGRGEHFLRQALARLPNNAHVHRELAACLHQQERLEEALIHFAKVTELVPDDSQAALVTTLILDKLGRADEARTILEGLVARFPEIANHWLAYALNLRAAGRTDESIEAYRKAIAIDPERGDAWWGIASIKKSIFTDQDIVTMQEQVEIAVDVANLAPLHFALARAFHERKEFATAFEHYREANRLWAEAIDYQTDELTEEVDQAQLLFDQSFFEKSISGGHGSNAPIFVVSLPRSGSTLLEQMLGSHADVEPLGELPYMPALIRSMMERASQRGISSVPEAIRALSPSDRTAFGQEYLRRVAVHRQTDTRYFTDKLPHNWSNVLFIRQILPNARIVDVRRDPIDCCFSNFSHSFSRAHASSFALEHIGRTYVDYVRFMDHLDRVAPGMIHHLRYEELIEDPKREFARLNPYLGLPWDDAILSFHESKRTVRTPSAEQVRRPLNRDGVAAWKPYEQWLDPLFKVLAPVLGDAGKADR